MRQALSMHNVCICTHVYIHIYIYKDKGLGFRVWGEAGIYIYRYLGIHGGEGARNRI